VAGELFPLGVPGSRMNYISPTKRNLQVAFLIMASGLGLFSLGEDECMRGKPYPVFSKDLPELHNRRFSLKSAHEANERVQLKSGESIRIHHWGCEYYMITFRVESAGILKAGMSKSAAFKEAVLLLRKLQQLKADSVFNLGLAANTLEKAILQPTDLSFDEQFPVEGDGTDFLQTQVKVDSAGRIGKAGFIEISLLKGPL